MALIILLISVQTSFCQVAGFGVALNATPVLNSPEFSKVFGGSDGISLKTDRCGQVRELEFIALPGTSFKIVDELKQGAATIYQVETDDYITPPGVRLYVDKRFLGLSAVASPKRALILPSPAEITAALKNAEGSPYVWGGNVQAGVPELLEWFFNGKGKRDDSRLKLAGLDCSGLLYQATAGWTPRNTSQLISFGQPVAITGKNAAEIAGLLEPLDLIVWNGHVLIVLDKQTSIESRLDCGKPGNGGVVTTPLQRRLAEIMRTRRPVDSWPTTGKRGDVFVVRRWF